MVICNLQETPYDDQAVLIIRERCDKIMRGVAELLNIQVPPLEYKIPFTIESQFISDHNYRLLLRGTKPNVPCMCVEEIHIKFMDKNYTLDQNRDLSFSLEIKVPASTDLCIVWTIHFKSAFEVPPLILQDFTLNEKSRICHMTKIINTKDEINN